MERRSFIGSMVSAFAAGSLLGPESWARLREAAPARPQAQPDENYWRSLADQFTFEDGLTYLNTGSLGGSPEIVQQATNEFRRMLDAFPSKYMWSEWWDDREVVRQGAARFVGAEPDEIALTHNTCEGLNLVASSLRLEPGDEIIACDHEHHTGVIPLRHYQEKRGVKLVRPVLPVMPASRGEILDVYRKAINSRTRAILISHMVNTNGLIQPVAEISRLARTRNIKVIVDGAQTVGMIPVDMKELGCHFYAASGHKWLFGPKGTGLFYVETASMNELSPLIVSAAFYNENNARKFENYNTRNVPEVLGLGTSIDFHETIGMQQGYQRILELKRYLRDQVEARSFLRLKTPAADDLSAGITSVEVVGKDVNQVARALDEDFRINCRPMSGFGLNGLRISTPAFVLKSDIDELMEALTEISQREDIQPPAAG